LIIAATRHDALSRGRLTTEDYSPGIEGGDDPSEKRDHFSVVEIHQHAAEKHEVVSIVGFK
jgi:hypothetical protein